MAGVAADGGGEVGRARRSHRGRPGTPGLLTVVRRQAASLAAWGAVVGRALWRGLVKFYGSDDLTHAASIAYYALLSLFPFFLLGFSILGALTTGEARREATASFLLRYFPTHFEFLTAQLDALQQTRVRLGLGGGVALTWAALGVFGAISSAVNHAWGVEQPRSFLQHKLFSFLMLLAAGVLLAAALLLNGALQVVHAAWFAELAARFPALDLLGSYAVRHASTVMLVAVVALVFFFVPNTRVRFRDVWPGAILTGLLWRGALEGFSYYVRDMSRYTLVHGSIAAVVVFLVWVYTCAVLLLYGVEFTAAYARLLAGRDRLERRMEEGTR